MFFPLSVRVDACFPFLCHFWSWVFSNELLLAMGFMTGPRWERWLYIRHGCGKLGGEGRESEKQVWVWGEVKWDY